MSEAETLNTTGITLLRGLVRTLNLASISYSLHTVSDKEPAMAEMLLSWAARSVQSTRFERPREIEPMSNAAYLLALCLRDNIKLRSDYSRNELRHAIQQARKVVQQ